MGNSAISNVRNKDLSHRKVKMTIRVTDNEGRGVSGKKVSVSILPIVMLRSKDILSAGIPYAPTGS